MKTTTRLSLASSLVLILFLIPLTWSGGRPLQGPKASTQQSGQASQVTVPNRPASPLYKGEQGKQRSEIKFTPSSRTVTIKLMVEDPNGYFLPNIRRENFGRKYPFGSSTISLKIGRAHI